MEQLSHNLTGRKQEDLRLLPLAIAAVACFVIAVTSGYLLWYLLSSKSPLRNSPEVVSVNSPVQPVLLKPDGEKQQPVVIETSPQPNPVVEQPKPAPEPEKPAVTAPAGEIAIAAGEIVMGGGETKLPLKRQFVEEFAIAETEVTNRQFREFIEATESKIKKPTSADDEPVTGVSWSEAKLYCEWLSRKLGVEVRLPTEAEWEMAARGDEGYKYPWGNEWRDEAAVTKETNGKIQAVKSLPLNKSPFGVFDMAGNVWEWTADASRDEAGKVEKFQDDDNEYKNAILRIIKGGAAAEQKSNISGQSRAKLPENARLPLVGFRYVVIRKNPVSATNTTK